MNGDIDTRPELADYLGRVRAGLADLPPEELTEVMEDVEPHVTEVFGEAGTAEEVVTRLGTPEAYAAELRAAGGYPPPVEAPPGDSPRQWRARYAYWATGLTAAVAALTGMAALSGYELEVFGLLIVAALFLLPAGWLVRSGQVRRLDVERLPEHRLALRAGRSLLAVPPERAVEFLRTLQPAWWLLRIVLLGLAFLAAVDDRAGGLVVILLVAALLVWCAPRVPTDRRLLLVVVPANAFVAGLGLALAVTAMSTDNRNPPYYSTGYGPSSGLVYDGGRLDNVYAVDGAGKAIPEFYLYDEDGAPLNVLQPDCGPTRDREREYRNRFPLPRVSYDRGVCVEREDLPFVPLPPVSGSAATTPSAPSAVPSTTVTPPGPASSPAPTTPQAATTAPATTTG